MDRDMDSDTDSDGLTWQLVDVQAELSLFIIGHGFGIFVITACISTQGTLFRSRPG